MPDLPLYYATFWPCSCCGLENEFVFMSQSDQTICGRCKRHGQDDGRKLVLHRDWWRKREKELLASHAAESTMWRAAAGALETKIAERDSRLADMRAVALRGYEQTPLGGIRQWLQEGIVVDAETRMRGAYRSRDRVMATIWRLDRLHHDAKAPDQCSCGKRTNQCREYQALAPLIELLESWETKQIEFLKRELEHHLPKEHPEVVKRRSRYGWVA